MSKRDPRVDDYIAKAPAFAQPILVEARKRFHAAVAGLDEDIKWRVPFFSLGGRVVGNVAAFQKHVKVGVWTSAPGTMGLPDFVDVASVAELPAAKAFAAKVQRVAAANAKARGARPKQAKPAPTKKAAPARTKKAPPKGAGRDRR